MHIRLIVIKKQLKDLLLKPFTQSHQEAQTINTLKEIAITGYELLKSKRTINTKKGDHVWPLYR